MKDFIMRYEIIKILLSAMMMLFGMYCHSMAQTTFEKQYDNHGRADMAWDIVETLGGDFVVVSLSAPTPCLVCNSDGWIVKINSHGDTLWTRSVGGN